MSLKIGDPAPDFTLLDQDGSSVTLSSLQGQRVVIYFYPKDSTPGCTKEACNFRDQWNVFQANGIKVLGISKDDSEANRSFRDKFSFPFDLLSDSQLTMSNAYGVCATSAKYTPRVSLLIGTDRKVIEAFEDIDPSVHAGEVLEQIRHLRP